MENNKASIIEERCIYCGHCTQVCPSGAKKVRDGLTRARMTLNNYPKVYLSLAPSYVSEFAGIPSGALISAIKYLGFAGVSETALGAEIVSAETERFLKNAERGVYFSSACPVVVEYIRKYSSPSLPQITPIISPMLAHAKILKKQYGEEIKIIFAGPCICKKHEADSFKELIDVAITFKDLKNWFEKEKIDLTNDPFINEEEKFVPYRSGLGSLYPIEGGMMEGLHKNSATTHYMAFSDISTVKDVLKESDSYYYDSSIFIELLACKGGCVNGPAKLSHSSPALKRYEVIHRSDMGNPKEDFSDINLYAQYQEDTIVSTHPYTESEVKQALASVGKLTREDELNCSACGYDSCRDFAIAMLEGRAEDNMCASYMRKIAHDKANALLQKIPVGVLLVDFNLKIIDMNQYCASLMGKEVEMIYENYPGLNGMELKKICSFDNLFNMVLTTGNDIQERSIRENDKTWLLSIYSIQPHRMVMGVIQNLREPGVRKEWVLEKTKDVIKNHMATVQQVAHLLGENAAFTDSTLKSIIDSYKEEEKK